jgi:hypothetical protein
MPLSGTFSEAGHTFVERSVVDSPQPAGMMTQYLRVGD